jgi:hypothetical protein
MSLGESFPAIRPCPHREENYRIPRPQFTVEALDGMPVHMAGLLFSLPPLAHGCFVLR